VAVSVTTVPAGKEKLCVVQVVPQLMPAGLLVTVPPLDAGPPKMVFVTVRVKVAC